MTAKKTAKPKLKTREELHKEIGSLGMQVDLEKSANVANRRQIVEQQTTINQLRGFIAKLEMENALQSGYIQRILQEAASLEQRMGSENTKGGNCNLGHYHEAQTPEPVFKSPSLVNGPSCEKSKNYGSSTTPGKAWYEI